MTAPTTSERRSATTGRFPVRPSATSISAGAAVNSASVSSIGVPGSAPASVVWHAWLMASEALATAATAMPTVVSAVPV
jgi:hypothetical protein